MTALHLEAVVKQRGTGRRAVQVLRGVDLTLAAGEVVLLEGPSGSGKTTLLGVAGGVLTADAGQVVIADRNLASLSVVDRRRHRSLHVGFVFQRANLLGGLTARQNILLMGTIAGWAVLDAGREADRLIEALGLGAIADRFPRELSGGEEHRVAVARALVHRPALVLADEPTGNLDAETGRAVAGALWTLAQEQGSAVLVATHDVRLASFGSRRVLMARGRVVGSAST